MCNPRFGTNSIHIRQLYFLATTCILPCLLLLIVHVNDSLAKTEQETDHSILEWEKLWDDFEASECNYPGGWIYTVLDAPPEEHFTHEDPFLIPGKSRKELSPDSFEVTYPYESRICVSDVSSENTPGLKQYKRRDIIAFYAYKDEKSAQLVFDQVIKDDEWLLGWLPVRNAPGRGEYSDPIKFKVNNLSKKQSVFIEGHNFHTKKEFKIDSSNKGMSFHESDMSKSGSQLVLFVQRYKTVVIILGFWHVLESEKSIVEPNIKNIILNMPPQYKLAPKKMEERAKAIVDERVRILRVFFSDPDPKTEILELDKVSPFRVQAFVEEKIWNENKGVYEWSEPKKPVFVYLRMFPYSKKSKVSGPFRDLLYAYRTASKTNFAPDKSGDSYLSFISYPKSKKPYKTFFYGDTPDIDLGRAIGLTTQKGKSSEDYILDYNGRFSDFLVETGRIEEGTGIAYNRKANVGASIDVVAYYLSKSEEMINLAKSPLAKIKFTHIATVISTNKPGIASNGIFILGNEKGIAFDKRIKDYGEKLDPPLTLMPRDSITLGRHDAIHIHYLPHGSLWTIRGNSDEMAKHNKKAASFFIHPTGGEEDWTNFARDWGGSIVGGVFGVGLSLITAPWTGGLSLKGVFVFSSLLTGGTMVGDAVTRPAFKSSFPKFHDWRQSPDSRPILINPEGTVIGMDSGLNNTKFFLIEGASSFETIGGGKVFLNENHMTTIQEQGEFAAPLPFEQVSLPTSLQAALKDSQKIIGQGGHYGRIKKAIPEDPSLKTNILGPNQAEIDSAYAFIKIGAERGFFIFRELRKLPILKKLKTIAEKADREEMVSKYKERLEEIENNIGQALNNYLETFEDLKHIDVKIVEQGLQKYRSYLGEHKAVEQLKVLEIFEEHIFIFFREDDIGKEKLRTDFAVIK